MLPAQFLRSWLFVPGDDKRKLEHAAASSADAVIVDWEDAVLPERKPLARELCHEIQPLRRSGKRILLRINSYHSQCHAADLKAVATIRPDGLVLPKCESAEEVQEITAILRKAAGDWHFDFCPIVESPLGLLRAESIATASDQVRALLFGAHDFCVASEIHPSLDETELLMARSAIVTVAKAYRLAAIDSPVIALDSLQTVREAAQRSFRLGFTGKLAIHPKHVAMIAEAFTPTSDEANDAEEILQQATQKVGAFAWKGQMIDEAILEKARRTVQRFQAHVKEPS
jgi:citrate lyase beta subunit